MTTIPNRNQTNDARRHNRLIEWLEQASLDMPKEELLDAAAAAFPDVTVGEFKRAAIDLRDRVLERDEERAALGLPTAADKHGEHHD